MWDNGLLDAGTAFNAVFFDTTANIQVQDTSFTFDRVLISFWAKQSVVTQDWIFEVFSSLGENSLDVRLRDTATEIIRITFGGGTHYDISSAGVTPDTLWHHYLISFDSSDDAFQLYIDDTQNLYTLNSKSVGSNQCTGINIGTSFQNSSAGTSLNGDLAEFYLYLNPPSFLDLNIEANRRKFIKNDKPVYLGINGELPMGSSPTVYMTGATDSWHENRGTFDNNGGNLNNTLATSTNLPIKVGT